MTWHLYKDYSSTSHHPSLSLKLRLNSLDPSVSSGAPELGVCGGNGVKGKVESQVHGTEGWTRLFRGKLMFVAQEIAGLSHTPVTRLPDEQIDRYDATTD